MKSLARNSALEKARARRDKAQQEHDKLFAETNDLITKENRANLDLGAAETALKKAAETADDIEAIKKARAARDKARGRYEQLKGQREKKLKAAQVAGKKLNAAERHVRELER
jgi:hypothetical protein